MIPGPNNRTNNGSIPESPLSKDGLNNRRRMPPVNYGESDDDDIMPKDDESGDEATNPQNESLSPSSRLIECPKSQCFKKFRDLDALKYHLSYTHNDLKDDKPPIKKLKKKKKLLVKRKREANTKEGEVKNVKKEPDNGVPESTSKLDINDAKIKKEIKMEGNDSSRLSSSKTYPALNGNNYSEGVKLEPFTKNGGNITSSSPLCSTNYTVHGSSSSSQPLALTASSSSTLPSNANHFNSQTISAGSINLKSSAPINYLMNQQQISNHQQPPLNFESSKRQGSHQPPPAHGGSSHLHPALPPLMQNGGRGAMSMAKELDARLSSYAQNGTNDHRNPGYQPSPINLGSSRESSTSKVQNQHPGQLQRQRSSGGPASPAYSDISDEESSTTSTNITSASGNGTNSSHKLGTNRGVPIGTNRQSNQARPPSREQPRKPNLPPESSRSSSSQLPSSQDRKTEGTKPASQTFGPPPQHLPPELHGGSLAFPPHLAPGLPGLPPGFPPHLMASLAASMGGAATAGGHRFPSPIPPMPGMPGASNQMALDILQQHANQYIATSKLQELQEKAGQSKIPGVSNSPSSASPSAIPRTTSPGMANLLGLNRGNVATSSPPLLRHEHNHTHLHLGYPPPGFPSPSGLAGTPPGAPSTLPTASNSTTQGSSIRGVAPPVGSIAVPGAPPPSHLPPPSPSPLMSGMSSKTLSILL